MTHDTDTYECAICAAYGTTTRTASDTATEIPHDADRDGLERRRVYACADCVAAGAAVLTQDGAR